MSEFQRAAFSGGPRFSLAPLEELLRAQGGSSVKRLALLMGTNERQVHRWRHHGVTWAQADLLAVRAGLHPAELWPQWFDPVDDLNTQ